MTPAEANVAFPALIFTKDLATLGAPVALDLTRWYKDAIERKDMIIGMELVGADYRRFTIQDVQVGAELDPLPSAKVLRFLAQRFRKRRVAYEVRLDLTPSAPMTLDQIKARIRDILVDKPEVYLMNYSPENDLPENAEYIAMVDDVDSLPSVLAELAAMTTFEQVYDAFFLDYLHSYDGPIDVERYR